MVGTAVIPGVKARQDADLLTLSAEVNQTKAKQAAPGSDDNQPAVVSPFAGGKAFPAKMDADAMTLAAGTYLSCTLLGIRLVSCQSTISDKSDCAGTVSAMLAANAANGDVTKSPEAVSTKSACMLVPPTGYVSHSPASFLSMNAGFVLVAYNLILTLPNCPNPW